MIGKMEIFSMDENGAGWVDFDSISKDEKLDIELALLFGRPVTLCCWICSKPIPSGTGNTCGNCK